MKFRIYRYDPGKDAKPYVKEYDVTLDQVLLAVGRPVHKSRETKEGLELEDWVYGKAPGRITFVTFNGNKVIKVKESYAGLGTEAAPTLPTN